mmetsp:Transcript_92190/g.246484  ORF Transcript_92190/g.246484 Transcript_92190/m.246484 type:complete len:366 (-) Transcript_92190:128-1225(-)
MDSEPQTGYVACAPLNGLVGGGRVSAAGKVMGVAAAATLGVVGVVLWQAAPAPAVAASQQDLPFAGEDSDGLVTVHRIVAGACHEAQVRRYTDDHTSFTPGTCLDAGYTFATGFISDTLPNSDPIQLSTFSHYGVTDEEKALMADNSQLLAQLAKLQVENRKMAKLLPDVTMSAVEEGRCHEVKVPALHVASSGLEIGSCASKGFAGRMGAAEREIPGLGKVPTLAFVNEEQEEDRLIAENTKLLSELTKLKMEDAKMAKLVQTPTTFMHVIQNGNCAELEIAQNAPEVVKQWMKPGACSEQGFSTKVDSVEQEVQGMGPAVVTMYSNQEAEEQRLMAENSKLLTQLAKLKVEDGKLAKSMKVHI